MKKLFIGLLLFTILSLIQACSNISSVDTFNNLLAEYEEGDKQTELIVRQIEDAPTKEEKLNALKAFDVQNKNTFDKAQKLLIMINTDKAIQDSTIDIGYWKDELEFYQYKYGLRVVNAIEGGSKGEVLTASEPLSLEEFLRRQNMTEEEYDRQVSLINEQYRKELNLTEEEFEEYIKQFNP